MPQKHHERFGIELGVTEAKRRFVNRALNFVLDEVIPLAESRGDEHRKKLERHICSKLGERHAALGSLERVLGTDFDKCLRTLESLHELSDFRDMVACRVSNILAETEIDIGIRWSKGQFLPAGAPILDRVVINDSLNLVATSAYKGVSDAFTKGLDHFLHSTQKPSFLADVITDMYDSLEALVKIVCGNDKGINANRDTFIKKLSLHASYNKMLAEYIDYANLIARHAGEKGQAKPMPSRKEVEAFVYLTGLFIRLSLSKNS